MGYFHWLIVVPYYFLAALAVLPVLILACRLTRAKININVLVGTSIAMAVAAIVVPLASDMAELEAYTGRRLLVLIAVSMLFATLDGLLADRLPLPLDDDLRDL